MAWSSMVPTAPPSVETMLADQAARWNSYYPQASVAPDEEDLWSVIPKGNMFFSSEQYQPQITMVTGNTRQPFTWQGNNKSLRDAYKATYDAQYQGIPETTTFYDTWKGPEIRALYGAEEESPLYWQDNDMSGILNYDIDDTLQQQQQPVTQGQDLATTIGNIGNREDELTFL